MNQTIISQGTRSISIVKNAKFEATLYVNCDASGLGDRTLVSHKFSTLHDAITWAKGVLEHRTRLNSAIDRAYGNA